MYEIRCIVGDKKLREVLVFLNNNNTLEPPVVIPTGLDRLNEDAVKTAIKDNMVTPSTRPKTYKKRPKSKVSHGGWHKKGTGSVSVVRAFIEQTGCNQLTARDMKDATMRAGYSANAYSHAIKLLLADNTIRPVPGFNGHYRVVNPTPISHSTLHEVNQHG